MRYIIFLFIALAIGNTLNAQLCNYKLYGHVEDADTKEKLIAANITIKENGQQFITDNKGDFVFSKLCAGNYTVLIAHIGCDSVEKKITITKDVHIDILLPHSSKVLSSITVNSQKTIANTGFKKELSGRNLEETKGLSLAEALSKMNGVTILQTGSTISKPVIHGLHSNRILTINNGVRQEGQQWGNEHAPEIDPFIADKLIVIKGVDELRYGSDAIGGVILVEPKPLRNLPGQAAEVNAGYFTNNKQYVISGVFEQQLKKYPVFRYRLQGTFKKGANVATPNYRLNNTGNEEKSFSITTGFKKETFNTELFYSHYNTKVGIFLGSHIGNLTDLQAAIASPQPNAIFLGQNTYNIQRPFQEVTHSLLKSKTAIYKGEHKFTILLAGQFNSRKEYDIVRSTTNQNPQLDLSINTYTQDVSWEHPKRNNFSGVAGIAATQQSNSYKGRYFIPNYFSYAFGGYYIEKWSKHKWELQGGIRYDNKSINTTRLKFNADTINYDFNFSTLASSFNAIFKPNNHWKINSNISFASRAPHVNELLSDGIHHGTATYEKGDITLKPEHAINISVGINYQHPSDKFSIDVLLYTNGIKNFIYQQPMPSNPVLTIAGAFPLIEYKQTDAVLSGIDVSTNVLLSSSVNWVSKFSFLNARNTTTSDWLILMPANRCNNEIAYNFKDGKIFSNTYASIEIANVMEQKNIPSDVNGKKDYKAPPPAYTLVNCNAATTTNIGKVPVTLSLGVRNILNTTCRDYLNSMRYFSDEMGRNISFRLKIQL